MLLVSMLARSVVHFAVTTAVHTSICTAAPTAPTILQPVNNTSTKSSVTTVSGSSLDYNTKIVVLENGQTVASTTSDSSGNFGVSITLVANQNQIIARASNICSITADSQPVVITYNAPKPPPPPPPTPPPSQGNGNGNGNNTNTSTSPKSPSVPTTPTVLPPSPVPPDQSATSGPLTIAVITPSQIKTPNSSVSISGTTTVPSSLQISVNGQPVANLSTDASGYFNVLVPLHVGSNNVTITATSGQNTAIFHLDATRMKPASALQKILSSHGNKLWIIGAAILFTGIIFGIGTKLIVTKLAIGKK